MTHPKMLLAVSLALLPACSSRPIDLSFSHDHPAHPGAAQAPYLAPPDALGTEARSFASSSTQPSEATRPAVPTDAARHLTRLLEAYLAVGDLLAADTDEGAKPHATQIDAAMVALSGVNLAHDSHFWHRNDTQVQTIRQQAQAIVEAKELKRARVAYGILSDALERLTKEVGVPAGFDKPVYSFTCGMFEAAPRDGVWLQVGDDARNPYYGSTMLGCYRTEYELPTVKTADQKKSGPPDEHGGHEQHPHANHDHKQGGEQ